MTLSREGKLSLSKLVLINSIFEMVCLCIVIRISSTYILIIFIYPKSWIQMIQNFKHNIKLSRVKFFSSLGLNLQISWVKLISKSKALSRWICSSLELNLQLSRVENLSQECHLFEIIRYYPLLFAFGDLVFLKKID